MKNYEHHCATGREERGEPQGVFSTLGPGERLVWKGHLGWGGNLQKPKVVR